MLSTVEPRLSGHRLSGLFDYLFYFSNLLLFGLAKGYVEKFDFFQVKRVQAFLLLKN